MKPRILDLFCGAGGAAMGLHQAGFEVVGVDIKPQPHYPFEFHQGDALTYPLEGFDAYWASPPCQHYSAIQHIFKNKHKHPALIDATRLHLETVDKPYVIENVVGAPIRRDLMLCGSMFGLSMIRHRIFESSVPMPILTLSCNHQGMYDPWHGGHNNDELHQEMARGQREKFAKAMGIDWYMTRPEVREAIPPAYSRFIGEQLMKVLVSQ